MFIGKLTRILSAAVSTAGVVAYVRYRKEMDAIRAALDSGGTIAETEKGPIEYAEAGEGEPFLMVHGAGGGYDQGLLIAEDFDEGYRVIAPSRFGYLKTPVPKDSSPAAQADAHAALLDFLGIQRAVVAGASAGAPSVIELALRHPERVSALILLVPRTYHPAQTAHADESAESRFVLQLVQSAADFSFWLATRVSRRSVVRFLGVPPEVEAKASEEDRERVTRVIKSILPLSSRARGILVDSAAEIAPWPLERISCPVLIISAEDDLFKTLPGARFTAEHIDGAELHVLRSGGHLMVGQTATVRKLVRAFLKRHRTAAGRDQAKHRKVLEPA
jgi:pimeloyl-ACP methyl ester carboxylesterase